MRPQALTRTVVGNCANAAKSRPQLHCAHPYLCLGYAEGAVRSGQVPGAWFPGLHSGAALPARGGCRRDLCPGEASLASVSPAWLKALARQCGL